MTFYRFPIIVQEFLSSLLLDTHSMQQQTNEKCHLSKLCAVLVHMDPPTPVTVPPSQSMLPLLSIMHETRCPRSHFQKFPE